jgi:tetratricopeptide (TPR) repeat protein
MPRNRIAWAVTFLLAAISAPASSKALHRQSGGQARADAIVDDVMDRLWDQVDRHWHKGEVMHIINLNKMIIPARPHKIDAFSNQGWLLWSQNREAEAEAVYEQGLRLNPDSHFLYDDVAKYYLLHRKDYKKAIYYYKKAVTLAGSFIFTKHALARAYEKAGQTSDALKLWQELARNPEDPTARTNLSRLERQLKNGDSQK